MLIPILIILIVAIISLIMAEIKDNPSFALLILLGLLIIPIMIIGGYHDNMPSDYLDNGFCQAIVEDKNGEDITIVFKEYKKENNCVVISDYYLFKFNWFGFPVHDYEHMDNSVIVKLPDKKEFQYQYYEGTNKQNYEGTNKQKIIEDCEK